MKQFKTIKLLLSTLLLFVLSFNANAELPDNALQMQEHLNILGYKTTIPDSNSSLMAVSNDGDILMFTKDDREGGVTIFRPQPLKSNIKKDIKFYKFLAKLNHAGFIHAFIAGDYLIISMNLIHKYNKEDFTQIVNVFNKSTDAVIKGNKKEILEYLK